MDTHNNLFNIRLILLSFTATLATFCTVKVTYNARLVDTAFKIIEHSRLYPCAAWCLSYSMCRSFNFDKRNKICYLNYGDQNISNIEDDSNFIYSEMDTWQNTNLGPCQLIKCNIFERCLVKRNKVVSCADITSNLAQGKPASASSKRRSQPGYAVDGSNSAVWKSSSCFHVEFDDYDPWWQVDLQDLFVVVTVHILGRADCCPERLHDFAVEVYKEDPVSQPHAELQLCYMYNGTVTEPGVTVKMTCTTPVTGRYLRVRGKNKLNDQDTLQFCEVEVVGFSLFDKY